MKKTKKLFLSVMFVASLALVLAFSSFALNADTTSAAVATNTTNTDIEKKSWQQTSDGKWQYYRNGSYVIGWQNNLDGWQGSWFYFDNAGIMQTGWRSNISSNPNTCYYFNENGVMQTGWQSNIPGWVGKSFYFDGNGAMLTGWQGNIPGWNGSYFYFDNNGVMSTGWKGDIIGWQGNWFYFNNAGVMQTGWQCNLDNWQGSYFYFDDSGVMQTGWKSDLPGYTQNEWFYFGPNGVMRTDWQAIDGFWYYFYRENDPNGGIFGLMASNCYINGNYINSQGHWVDYIGDMTNIANNYSSSTGYIILVNRSTHKVGVFTGGQSNWSNIFYWDCADGVAGTETVEGLFTVNGRGTSFDSGESTCYWWTRIIGDYMFHSTLFDHYGNSTDARVGMALSHGCVRLQIENAKWIYDNIPDGTTVYIYH